MENKEAISILALFDTTKSERVSFAKNVLENVIEGGVSPLLILKYIKCMEQIITLLTEASEDKNKDTADMVQKFKSALIDEARNNGNSFSLFGVSFKQKEAGAKYDYSVCNDTVYTSLIEKVNKIKEEQKERENYLKNIPSKGIEIVSEDGEVITLYPPSKSSTSIVEVKLS